MFAPNLKWHDVDIRNPIAKATGLEVTVENAANACVLAAVWFDHMEECRNLVVVTISEGIGTGVWANGQLVRGLNGMAGEFGHVPLDPKGRSAVAAGNGCWEVFGSNRAALRYYLESGAEPSDLTFLDLLSRADQGDQRAAKALETMAHYVGRGTRMVVAGLAPERIVMVGDLTRSLASFRPGHRGAKCRRRCCPAARCPEGDSGIRRRHGASARHGGAGAAERLRNAQRDTGVDAGHHPWDFRAFSLGIL